jgi:lipopolysaccharide/colanic/teichoic acid biosynthesis glycosyltransferase
MKQIQLWSKRLVDFSFSLTLLILLSPLLILTVTLIWMQDFKSPLYISNRVGANSQEFKMVKLRSMVTGADKSGVDSTSNDDQRVTKIGRFVRRYKFDELGQLWNVLIGNMSLVGPRPNVQREVQMYTEEERVLLEIKPGITDFASIVFADEGEILSGFKDPDLAYNQLIRPWKSRLGIFYVKEARFWVDFSLLIITAISLFSRSLSLVLLSKLLARLGAPDPLLEIANRTKKLVPTPPPGSSKIIESR